MAFHVSGLGVHIWRSCQTPTHLPYQIRYLVAHLTASSAAWLYDCWD